MKKLLLAAALGALVATTGSAAAFAQPPAPAAAPAKISFATTKISDLIKNAKAKAILEKVSPEIAPFEDQIGDMTLTDIIPLSQGTLDEAKIKAMQAEFDKG